jgi:hypothetical protein
MRRIAVGLLVAAVVTGLIWAWLALPGLIASRTLGLLGVVCDPVSIELTPDLSHASIARTECSFPAGPIASITLSSGAEVALVDLRPTNIDVPMLAVNPRAIEMAGAATAVLVTGDTPDPLRRVLGALAAAARRTDLPARTTVGEIDLGRGAYVVVARGLVIAHGAGTFDITLASIGPPAYHGRAIDWLLAVNEIEVHATPESAIITGHFDVNASLFSFPIARTIAFRLTGSALDGASATYDLWIEPSAELTWLRDHGQALLDQIRAAGGIQQAVEQQREVRATDRAERVHDLRERLDQQVQAAHERETPPPTTATP